MIDFDERYFRKFDYTKNGVQNYLKSAYKDLNIAKNSDVSDVVFQFAYNSFIKLGISLIAGHGYKINSRMGHHIKIIETMTEILNDNDIAIYGNSMRKIRNTELYDGGGVLLTEKQSKEYLLFIDKTFNKSNKFFDKSFGTLFQD